MYDKASVLAKLDDELIGLVEEEQLRGQSGAGRSDQRKDQPYHYQH